MPSFPASSVNLALHPHLFRLPPGDFTRWQGGEERKRQFPKDLRPQDFLSLLAPASQLSRPNCPSAVSDFSIEDACPDSPKGTLGVPPSFCLAGVALERVRAPLKSPHVKSNSVTQKACLSLCLPIYCTSGLKRWLGV